MLPDFLNSTYKKYKADTSTFVRWLSENAQKCGYELRKREENSPVNAPSKAPRLKGKTRKLAKGTSTGSKTTSDTVKKTNLVDSHELLPLANAIVKSKDPVVKVPISIIRAGLRAISARKRCAAYFKKKNADDDSETSARNDGHSYFIALMEETLAALQPSFTGSENAPQLSANESEDLENRFGLLDIQDPNEDDPTVVDLAPEDLTESIYELQPIREKKNLEGDKLFALFCLFDDLNRLRGYLQELWADYKSGRVDLITASVVTNSAFQLATRTQDEILTAHPGCENYQNVMATILNVLAKDQEGEEEYEIEIDDSVAHWIFTPAQNILDNFCDILDPREAPMIKRGYLGIYNPGADRSKMDETERLGEDQVLLMELLPEFCFVSKFKISLFTTDELTRGLSKMALTKEISIWLAFATTVFLDIHHMLRRRVTDGLGKLMSVGKHAHNTLEMHFQFSRDFKYPSTWPKQNQKIVQKLAKDIEESVLNDPIFPVKARTYERLRLGQIASEERFYLYERHPVLCGLQAFRTILELKEAGIALVSACGTVVYPAHLYNALRLKPTLVESWDMMDRVIAIHGEEQVFVGGPPKSLNAAFKQVCLMLGYSAQNFAQNRRNWKPVVSPKGPRGLKEISPIGNLFRDGLQGDGSMSLTMHNVEAIFNEQAMNSSLISNSESKSLKRGWQNSQRLSSLEFLQALRISITDELPKLMFNYFHMHEQCIKFLRQLRTSLHDDFRNFFGQNYLENESQLPFLGPFVLMIACNIQQTDEHLGLTEGSKLLERAGTVMETFVGDKIDVVEM